MDLLNTIGKYSHKFLSSIHCWGVYILLLSPYTAAISQVVTTDPLFPSISDNVTIFFHADEGNKALSGFQGPVYAHTGLITEQSSDGADWKNVVGNWGTADGRVLMTNMGDDLYTLSYNIQQFYNIRADQEVKQLAFVFRNVDGSIVGRAADGSDIYTDIFPEDQGLIVSVLSPTSDKVILTGDSLLVQIQMNEIANLVVKDNGELVRTELTDNLSFYITPLVVGLHELEIQATLGNEVVTERVEYFVVDAELARKNPPEGTRLGMNRLDSSFVFQLYAPGKSSVFFLCPENNFSFDEEYLMNVSSDGSTFWIELSPTIFDAGRNAYQYLVDGEIMIADPFAEVVLDPQNDPFISVSSLNELPPYPESASGVVSVFDLEERTFEFLYANNDRPEISDLVIYELLIRDFLGDHSYLSLIDTLDYLASLGVNAIELMPIHEFEGNISWGYNPSYHLAVDKYYGTRDELKLFIDEAHKRGMAVILDVVFNHVFGQSPLARLYWDAANSRPAEDNPYLNPIPRHPFNVGYDVNHESEASNIWVKRNLEQWVNDYQFDGFRFDLSKGLTQTFSGDDANFMARYDPSRIAILKEYADFIWSLDSGAYVIMEHFADNEEERELADYGMLLWSNNNFQFAEAAMGYRSDLGGADYTQRGWEQPHLIAYMESHDEERIAHKIFQFGNEASAYSTRNLETAMDRLKAINTIYFSIPGPKMMWQFGELGYDFSINYCQDGTIQERCRVDPKPIRWDYLEVEARKELMETISSLIYLRTQFPTFSTEDFVFDGSADPYLKRLLLTHPEMDVVVLANFDISSRSVNPSFPSAGTWYEYLSEDSLTVTDPFQPLTFQPGEYRLYTSKRVERVTDNVITNINPDLDDATFTLFPNPVQIGAELIIEAEEFNGERLSAVKLRSVIGTEHLISAYQHGTKLSFVIPVHVPKGIYMIHVKVSDREIVEKVLIY